MRSGSGSERAESRLPGDEVPPPWDGDGAWREEAPRAALPSTEDTCARLLAAAAAFRDPRRGRGESSSSSSSSSPLAFEAARLERASGRSAAAAAAARCRDASGRSAAHVAARVGDLDGLDAIFRIRLGGEGDGGSGSGSGSGSGGEIPFTSSPSTPSPSTSSTASAYYPSASPSSSALADEGDAHGVAALALSAWQGHVRVVDYLLRRGANPNRRDDYGVAAIHKAVGHGHLRCALRILGDGGADPNLRVGDVSDRVPAAYRAVSRHQTALHVACYRRAADGAREPGDARMVAALLRYGADVDAKDDNGDAAAHHAAAACDAPVTRLLVRAGANLRLRNAEGKTPGMLVPRGGGCNAALMFDVMRGVA